MLPLHITGDFGVTREQIYHFSGLSLTCIFIGACVLLILRGLPGGKTFNLSAASESTFAQCVIYTRIRIFLVALLHFAGASLVYSLPRDLSHYVLRPFSLGINLFAGVAVLGLWLWAKKKPLHASVAALVVAVVAVLVAVLPSPNAWLQFHRGSLGGVLVVPLTLIDAARSGQRARQIREALK
jgi:hypothetical protein